MKKFLVLAVAAMMATMSVSAQNGYDTKHEVGISYGFLSNSQWLNVATIGANYYSGYDAVGSTNIGPISAEYFYHINEWLGVGGIFSYGRVSTKYNSHTDQTPAYTNINSSYSLMPAVKFNWLRLAHFGMYSKVGVGVLLFDVKAVPADASEKTERALGISYNFQASAIGMEFGGEQFRGFIEGGIGEQGVVLAGLRYKF